MLEKRLRKLLVWLRRTPIHPQWLIPRTRAYEHVVRNLSGRVLDVGCADRWIERRISSVSQYIGLDYPPTGAVLYGAKPDVFGTADALPYRTGSIDAVVMLEVLEHLEHPEATIREISRVLKEEGLLLLSVPFMYPIHDEPQDFQRYTKYGLRREIRSKSFEILEMHQVLGSVKSTGLIVNLSISGSLIAALRERSVKALAVFPVLLLIPVVNIACWFLSRVLPNFPGLTNGYWLVASKQSSEAGGQ